MKLFINITKPYLSNALRRIEGGILSTMPPTYRIASYIEDADLIIAPVVNYRDILHIPLEKTVIMQLCFKTAGTGSGGNWGSHDTWWQSVWGKSYRVVSYYDLPCDDYLRMPLGYNPKLFYNRGLEKKFKAIVTGFMDGPNGEEIESVYKAFGNIVHVGNNFELGEGYHHFVGVTDAEMATLYNQSEFVVALRHIEGFEFPVIEGAACGAIPIVFDMECYTHWFESISYAISPEEDIVHQLRDADVFFESWDVSGKPIIVDEFYKQFTWDNVMKPFWEYIE